MTARRVVRERIDPRLTAAQLETALREVCVTIPEATVPEFERRVNELMLVSLALAERRTRGSKKGAPAVTTGRKRQAGLWR